MKVMLFSMGFCEYMISLSNSLSKIDDVILILPKKKLDDTHLKSISKEVVLESVDTPRLSSPKIIFFLLDILRIIKKHKPDLIHIQQNGHPWFFLLYPFLRKYPIVDTFHDPRAHLGEETLRFRFKIWSSLRNTSGYIVHGKKLKEQMKYLYGVLDESVAVIPHGNLALFKKWQVSDFEEKKNHILFFGRISKYKGIEYLIKSEHFIKNHIKNFRIIIAGKGPGLDKHKKLIINNDNFILKDYWISHSEVGRLFQESAIVVLPYIEASQSGVAQLAFSFKKPVVATNVGSIMEAVDDGKNGILVPRRDSKKLAEAIIELLDNDELRRKMSDCAYEKSTTVFSWNNIAKLSHNFYLKVMKKDN